MICKHCQSNNLQKRGTVVWGGKLKQKYFCIDCRRFSSSEIVVHSKDIAEKISANENDGRVINKVLSKESAMSLHDERTLRQKKEAEKRRGKMLDESLAIIDKLEKEQKAILKLQEHPKPFIIKPRSSGGSEAVAVVLLSDWHVEEIVDRKVVKVNEYNPDIAKKRAIQCFQAVAKLIKKEQQDVEINELIIWLGGDFITSNIHEEMLEITAMRPVEAAMYAKELISSGLKFLKENFKGKITVVCSSGNHGRITHTIHYSKEYGNSLETFLYCSLRDEYPDLNWIISQSYHTTIEVFGRKIRFNHGHFVSYGGGVGGITIPLLKAINNWDTNERAELTCIGHFHQFMSHRRFVTNGSMIGFNGYAIAVKAEFEPPSQAFFLLDKRRGRSVTIPILFDN